MSPTSLVNKNITATDKDQTIKQSLPTSHCRFKVDMNTIKTNVKESSGDDAGLMAVNSRTKQTLKLLLKTGSLYNAIQGN